MGLARWFPFNGDAKDYSTNDASVSYNSGVSFSTSGKMGRCALFASGYVSTPNPFIGTNKFSFCAWVKPNSPNAWSNIFTMSSSLFRLESTDTAGNYNIYCESSAAAPIASGTNVFTGINSGSWTHIALVCDTSGWKSYVNGILHKSGSVSASSLFAGDTLYIGNRASSSYWAGYLNDVRFYNHALSLKEIKEIAKAKMLHYDFNNLSSTTSVLDSSGFKNNATIVAANSPIFTHDDSARGNSSFLFANGSKQSNGYYQYFQSTNTVRIPESGTMSYYLKQSGTQNSDNHYAVGFQNFCSVNGFGSGNEVGLIYYHDSSNYSSKTNTATIRDGNWHMYTISWTVNGNLKIYIDGVLIGTHAITTMAHASTYRYFNVGSAWDISYGGYSGYIDDVRLYATQLSDTDILEMYQTKASVSKNGKLFANEICETNFVTKEAYSAKWARIFYHNNKSGTVLFSSDKNEFLSCHTTDKISDLWALERFRDKDGKFELLLEYQSLTGYNRWKQTSNFTKEAISGYEAVAISWTSNNWGGLAPSSNSSSTWVDGSPGVDTWHFAIGSKASWEGGIPATSAETGTVQIWVRIDTVPSVKVTKKGIAYATEICEVDNTSMKTKTELSANWVRLFYHNNKSGTVLFGSDKNEFLKCNTGDKISDLWALEQFRGKDGKFELLLQYESGGTSYNRWKQSSNFTKEAIAGYEAVAISWTNQGWGGLELNTYNTSTWVDGTVGSGNWYYAIGARGVYSGGIPSWDTETGWVELWVRCDDINLFRMIKGGKCKATEFIEN